MKNKKRLKDKAYYNKIYPIWFAGAAILLYTLLYVVPALYGFALSFTNWTRVTGTSDLTFVGIKNYLTVFDTSNNYFKYIGNTLEFSLVTTIAKTILALIAALVINKGLHFKNFHRMALFFPSIISVVVTGLVFRSILRPKTGLLNQILILFSFDGSTDFLNTVDTAFNSVMAVDIWRGMGYIMVIFLAGLQSISTTYYEAADIDGAGYFSKLFYITLPLLKQTILVNVMLNLIYGLRVFDMVYVLTKGGPGDLTDVLYTSVFSEFGKGNYAVGSALSSVMLMFMLIVGAFFVRYITKQEVEQ